MKYARKCPLLFVANDMLFILGGCDKGKNSTNKTIETFNLRQI